MSLPIIVLSRTSRARVRLSQRSGWPVRVAGGVRAEYAAGVMRQSLRLSTSLAQTVWLALLVAVTASSLAMRTAAAQEKPRNRPAGFPTFPGFDGQAFFEQFFGGGRETPEELARIEVSLAEEQDYGQRVWQSFEDDFKKRKIAVVTRGREVEYLRKLVATLQPQMTNRQRYRNIRVVLADTETTDAYSIPGGTLVVFRGMMELAQTEAALAGVLGHELSHLDRGHQLLPLRRMKYARQQSGTRITDPATMFRQANVFMSAFLRPFRPEDESEADRDGATWAYREGYDPRAMSALFTRLNERDQVGRFAPAFLRSHPYHVDRLAAIEELFLRLQASEPRTDLYLGRTNLERLVPLSERRFEE